MLRYIVGVLVAIGLLIVIFALIFLRGPSSPAPKPIDLASLANTGSKVQLTIDGQVTADSEHRAIRITVGASSSELDIIGGYNGNIISSHSVNNNTQAYYVFLKALQTAGFNIGKNDNSYNPGFCPLGQRHLYKVISAGGQAVQHLWGSTCGGGTFQGDSSLVITLFENQIPNYSSYTSDINF